MLLWLGNGVFSTTLNGWSKLYGLSCFSFFACDINQCICNIYLLWCAIFSVTRIMSWDDFSSVYQGWGLQSFYLSFTWVRYWHFDILQGPTKHHFLNACKHYHFSHFTLLDGDIIRMVLLPILYFKVSQVEMSILSIPIFVNSTDPVKIQNVLHYVAFQMGLHCLPK